MKTDKRHEYSAPQLTVVSFKSERGFASSSPDRLSLFFGSSNDEHVETHPRVPRPCRGTLFPLDKMIVHLENLSLSTANGPQLIG